MGRGKKKALKQTYDFLKSEVLKLVSEQLKRGLSRRAIHNVLGMSDGRTISVLDRVLSDLTDSGFLVVGTSGRYFIGSSEEGLIGEVQINLQGNGYVVVEGMESDVFVPFSKLNCALNGDKVEVLIQKRKKSGVLEGRITKVLSRHKVQFVGVVDGYKDFSFVKPRDVKCYKDFYVRNEDLNGATHGDVVLLELTIWQDATQAPNGKVKKILGRPGQHDTEIHTILAEYGLPSYFPEDVQAEADSLRTTILEADLVGRQDFRGRLTFTIDPRDAKDFDDALSFVPLEEGWFEIGIHIADVSHYLKEGSVLDEEAVSRGTSVYLVDRVVPMLPEILSNHACSLRPLEDKLTFSVVFEMNISGEIRKEWIGRTVIHSNYRLAYEEAQCIIERPDEQIPADVALSGKVYEVNAELRDAVIKLDRIAKVLRSNRMKMGAISFDKIEVKFRLNDVNEPEGVYFKEAKDSNKLIEEFMLLANRRVAEVIGKAKGNFTFVYRVHDKPDEDKLLALNTIIGRFGHSLNFKSHKTLTSSLNKLLIDVKGKREQNLVDTLAIRSMSKAIYTTQNIGHYGLAFTHYTHFTSPIRRYPDVMVHRLLALYLDKGRSQNEAKYEALCKQSTDREILASNAERDSIKFMQVRYMQGHKDRDFVGVISGVTEWGIYVEIIENKCEGMVRMRDLKGDFYIFKEREYAIIGERTGRRYQLGDEVVVRVKHTDVIKRHLDFEMVDKGGLRRALNYR
jgi:ribonuclease R/exosome complex exonuclease DIS3/RRP44